ncbi:MAG: glycosyltransferase family 39 protein, partial [Myxococcota bacterium]|nr:glycosyltransferase family 39 protein [Myxococcota bacterium]
MTPSPTRARMAAPILVAAILYGIAALRFPLWNDELFTWWAVQGDLDHLLKTVTQDAHPPLYFLLTRGVFGILDGDLALRLPSLIAMLLAVAVTRWTTHRHLGETAAEWAAWGMALSPLCVALAANARMYGLLALCGAALLACSLELVRGQRPGLAAIAMSAVSTAALFTHYSAVAPIAGAAAGTLLGLGRSQEPGRLRRMALLAGALLLQVASNFANDLFDFRKGADGPDRLGP